LLHKKQNVQVSDTTNVEQCTMAGTQKYIAY